MGWRNVEKGRISYLPLVNKYKEIIVFDTETTGLKKDSKIIQFSAIKYQIDDNYHLTKDSQIDIYINPREFLSEKITEITGITDEMLSTAKTEEEIAPYIFSYMGSCDLWGAYNSPFDLAKLEAMADRTGIPYFPGECIDILEMAKDCVKRDDEVENHKLGTVFSYLYPDEDVTFHSSIEDVGATGKVMEYCLKYYQNFMSNEETIQARLQWASYSENPHQKSQKRIKLNLNVGEYGDVYWDVVNQMWACKKNTKAKKVFAQLDMENMEQQVLNKYGWKYHANDMKTLASSWGKAKRAS